MDRTRYENRANPPTGGWSPFAAYPRESLESLVFSSPPQTSHPPRVRHTTTGGARRLVDDGRKARAGDRQSDTNARPSRSAARHSAVAVRPASPAVAVPGCTELHQLRLGRLGADEGECSLFALNSRDSSWAPTCSAHAEPPTRAHRGDGVAQSDGRPGRCASSCRHCRWNRSTERSPQSIGATTGAVRKTRPTPVSAVRAMAPSAQSSAGRRRSGTCWRDVRRSTRRLRWRGQAGVLRTSN